jgi:hypothetical protein
LPIDLLIAWAPAPGAYHLRVRRHRGVEQLADRVRFGQSAELSQAADALPPGQLQIGRSPCEQNPVQLTVAEHCAQFVDTNVYQERRHDPDLDCEDPVPAKMRGHAQRQSGEHVAST